MLKEKILISACLLGIPCRYDGRDNKIKNLTLLQEQFELIPVCPEQLGGLSTPRCPCEIQKNKVISREGKDYTREFQKGAEESLKLAKQRSEEHTSELQSRQYLVCRLLLEKKKIRKQKIL